MPTSLEMDKEGKTLFILNGKNMQKMNMASDDLKPIKYLAQVKLDLAAEREYMFDHVYKQQQKRFYNTNMHGVNWDTMTAAYRKFLPHINNNYDFSELLSEWLGELNVSHTVSIRMDKVGLQPVWDYFSTGTTRIKECSLPK